MTTTKKILFPLLLLLAFLHSLWALSYGWWNSILDEHSFRQAQTALTALYLLKGGPFFSYETPVLGAPWSIPFELPVYQWLVAKFSLISHLPLEQAGRVIGRFFFYAMLWPLNGILRHFQVQREGRFIALTIFLLSPMYLFWSRAFLIESTATFFAIAFFYSSLQTFSAAILSPTWLFLTCVLGIFAGTIKATTGFSFFLLAALYFLYQCFHTSPLSKRRVLEFSLSFLLPGLCTVAWILHTDHLKSLNPMAEFILSSNLKEWNYGTLAQRVSGKIWYMFFRKTLHDSIGHRTVWIISVVLLPFIRPNMRKLAIASSVAFLIAPMTFTNLHIAHNYYWMANGVFLVLYLGFVLEGLITDPRMRPYGYVLYMLTIFFCLRQFHQFELTWQKANNWPYDDLIPLISEKVPENDVIMIFGAGWYPAAPWVLKRRAVMVQPDTPVGSPRFMKALELIQLDGKQLRLVLQCNTPETGHIEALQKHVGIEANPLYKGSCVVYEIRKIHATN